MIVYEGTNVPVPCACPSDCGCKPWNTKPNACGCVQPHTARTDRYTCDLCSSPKARVWSVSAQVGDFGSEAFDIALCPDCLSTVRDKGVSVSKLKYPAPF